MSSKQTTKRKDVTNEKKTGCENCGEPLGTEVKYCDGHLWHPGCVQCYNCKKAIQKNGFHIRENSLFCKKCYKFMYLPRCVECCCPIKVNNVGIKAMGVTWHDRCFRCRLCKQTLQDVSISYIVRRFKSELITHKFFVLFQYTIFNNYPMCVNCVSKERSIMFEDVLGKDLLTHLSPSSAYAHDTFTARPSLDDDDEFRGKDDDNEM